MDWDAMAVVGTIARSHGIRGQVIVNPESDFAEERFRPGVELFVRRAGALEKLTLTSARFHRERPIVGIAGIETVEQADTLAGLELRIPSAQLAPLPEGTFYRHDLVGCRVETTTGAAVGIVREVEGTVGGSRLVVDGPRGDVLIPLASAICIAIDPGARRIVIDPPDGLLDLNAR